MRSDFEAWLRSQGYPESTISSRLSWSRRVEQHYGNLDEHYDNDRLQTVVRALTYSTEDARRGRPNPTSIPLTGDVRNNLASYKSAVLLYVRFRENGSDTANSEGSSDRVRPKTVPRGPVASRPSPAARVQLEPRAGRRTLVDFELDGAAALEAIIASSQYRTVAQAVASLTLFSHPQTVRQTGGQALFPAVRDPKRVGQIDTIGGRRLLLDDNASPTAAFFWANGLSSRPGRDLQLNHVYSVSKDPDAYTALPNLCITPAFVAKLTDTGDGVPALLRYRAWDLYGWAPAGHPAPERPDGYETLEWASPLPAVADVRTALELTMASKPKNRTVMAARELGWLFGEPSLPPA